MNTGIIRTALTKTLPLELDYREPSLSGEDEAISASLQAEWSDPRQHVAANEFHQLLRAI